MYLGQNEVTPGVRSSKGEIFSDITTNFVALCAIYFPSVTGNEDFREGRREGKVWISVYYYQHRGSQTF